MRLGATLAWVIALGALAGASERGPDSPASGSSSAAPILSIRLTASEELSEASRRALVAETEAIWRNGPIHLDWLIGPAAPGPGANLRVLVMARPVASTTDGPQWTVGELLRFEDQHAIAIASIAGAQRIVYEGLRFQLFEEPVPYEHRLGVVLGRAVAHEIGHYLLRTNTHASHGLMRATIDAREFADLRADTFRLDDAAQAHLALVAARGALPAPASDAFVYPAR